MKPALVSNLADLASYFRIENADIAFLKESVIVAYEPADFFYSFGMLDGQLCSLNVRHPVSTPRLYHLAERGAYSFEPMSEKRFSSTGGLFFPISEWPVLAPGDDPRLVSDGERAFGIISPPRAGARPLLYDLKSRGVLPINVQLPNFQYGKNWQPFLADGRLFAIYQLAPFKVLSIDTETGLSEFVKEKNIDFRLNAFYHHYPMLRGGANAIQIGELLIGLGKATTHAHRHHPFLWAVAGDGQFQALFTEFFCEFHDCGFNIIDPTSLFIDGDTVFVGLCCSERNWVHTQVMAHFLLALRKSRRPRPGYGLADYFLKRRMTDKSGLPNLDRHLFFCSEMPSMVPSAIDVQGRSSSKEAGYLVRGPFVELSEEGLYCAELTYITGSVPGVSAGRFEVSVTNFSEAVREHVIAQAALVPTHNILKTARVQFDTKSFAGSKLETRVFVERNVELTACHIRTWRADDASTSALYPWSGLPEADGK